jgi:hypothetical protein
MGLETRQIQGFFKRHIMSAARGLSYQKNMPEDSVPGMFDFPGKRHPGEVEDIQKTCCNSC